MNGLRKKKIIVLLTVIISLSILFVFKYLSFFLTTVSCFYKTDSNINEIVSNLILPVGISFYTFQTIGYVVDVYRGKVEAEKNLGIYATFIAFFPQLVAGPIERTTNLLSQIKENHEFDYKQAVMGLKLLLIDYYKKLVIADVIVYYVDVYYQNPTEYGLLVSLLAIFFFSIQIYCDFSGYSDIAIGSAKLLGINLMTNFASPYFATSIRQFWSRWHISLSSWFRDYVYIPLGGNRC